MPENAQTRSVRKCPQCGQWSAWTQQPTDTCEHCGQLLDPQTLQSRQLDHDLREAEKGRFTIDLIEIDPNEPVYLRWPKQVLRAIQISFVAVVSFLIWLIVAIAS